MELLTRQMLANQAASRWKEQYSHQGKWTYVTCGNAADVYHRLASLGDSPSPKQVDEVIGNGSWTSLKCNECSGNVDSVVIVGEPMDYDSSTAYICGPCLCRASELFA